ncbi:MAG: prepilin-type N-terminal cleavage/methylation domain-containing protein, partial [Calditerrivibrio sp.]|nr:prepilin-type N-terminal cleavage/methylation domain-containing protein [Calditerrivibrio sp.]
MKKGFTLIELVIVIVILGILAAVAVPKFVDLQSDARKSAVKGLAGAIQSAAAIGYAKYQIGPVTSGTNYDNVTINNKTVYF